MKKLTQIMLMAMMLITLTVIMAACFGYVTPTEKTYTITWKNYDGTILETDEKVKEGTMPSYDGETPVKADDSEYTYTFAGWEPEIVKATKDAVYTAKFDAAAIVIPVKTYTITWVNYDGTVLETDENVEEGTIPTYDGETPVREADATNTYTFAGWEPKVVAACADAKYTAKFDAEAIIIPVTTYTITWVNYDGTVLEIDENVEEGTMPSYDGATPVREADATNTYTFVGWEPTVVATCADAKYTAKFDATVIEVASEGLQFTLSQSGDEYIVSGIGTCKDSEIVIPSQYKGIPVTTIGERAFAQCTSFTSILMPDSIAVISGYAFWKCPTLSKIKLSANLISIELWAFNNCTNLLAIELPQTLMYIGYSAFRGCTGLEEINIPQNVINIDSYSFYGCEKLKKITIPENIPMMGYYAFYKTAWYNEHEDGLMYLNNTLITYKGTMPANTEIVIKEGTFLIADNAFKGFKTLVKIEIPNSVNYIGYNSFEGCAALVSVLIPDSVVDIGDSAFKGCTDLASINISKSMSKINENTFNKCTGLTRIEIPDNIESIMDSAFYNCSGLETLNLSKNLKSIGEKVFFGCTGLIEITVAEGNELYQSIDNCLIYKPLKELVLGCKNSKIPNGDYVRSIGSNAFYKCTSLNSLTLLDNIESIKEKAFYGCTNLSSIDFGKGLFSIGKYAFNGCSSLIEISLPDSINTIEDYAFNNCTNLQTINIPEKAFVIGRYVFDKTAWLTGQADGGVYLGKTLYIHKGTMAADTKFEIQNGTLAIASYAFDKCTNMVSVSIPESVTIINRGAFSGCSGLTEVVLPTNLELLCDIAFQNCSSLKSIKIPDKIESLGYAIFWRCTSLESIIIPESVKYIGESLFFTCTNLKAIYYCGTTMEAWNNIEKVNNGSMPETTVVYLYSDTEKAGCWHYVEGKPELWA